MYKIEISDVRFSAGSEQERRTGLLGHLSFLMNDIVRIDGVTLRQIAVSGQLTLSFPARRDRSGRDHPYVRPVDHAARLSIQEQVFNQLAPLVARNNE